VKRQRKNQTLLSALGLMCILTCFGVTSAFAAPRTVYLHVNTFAIGSSETGTSSEPFLTISDALHRASVLRRVTRDRIVIRVHPGSYSATTGERFPLCMVAGVDMEGMRNDLAIIPEPIIQGGANHDIGTDRYVALIAAADTFISGFTFRAVDGPDGTLGTSILCDDASPTIENNLFEGDAHAGVTVTGNAHPLIRDNDFSGTNNWGITNYGDSYPQIMSNLFNSRNGVDCSDQSHPSIDGNILSCESTGISTKGDSVPTITDNTLVDNGTYGIIVRMNSAPVIQGNDISDNPTGIYIGGGGHQNPDMGGGGRSDGGNEFSGNTWDIENHTAFAVMARNNRWSSFCCNLIDSRIYDNDESAVSGEVDYSDPMWCIYCRARALRSIPW
jgi:parallel beta-helix repeat protein